MNIEVKIDTTQFNRALNAYMETTKRALPDVLNQRAFNIAARTMDSLKPAPGGEQATRTKIKNYLNAPVSSRIKRIKSGRRKGQFTRRGSKDRQLARVNLIIQARRAKRGLKGLWGGAMAAAEGRFKSRAQVAVGFLKSPLIPVIKGLLPLVRFRKVATRWGKISVWPGSSGFGRVDPAKPGWNPIVEMLTRWSLPTGQQGKVSAIATSAMQGAFNAEAREITRHVEEKLQAEANKVNSR